MTPDPHYHVSDVLVDGSSVGAVSGYTFSNISANHTIAASFAIDQNTITASAGANGSITPSGAVAVDYGGTQAFSISANGGYHVSDVLVDGSSVGAVTGYTFSSVSAAHTITASFAIDTYGLTVNVVGGGSVNKNPDQPNYAQGTPVTLTAVPGTGWAFSAWSGDTTSAVNPIEITVYGAKSYTATFVDIAPPSVTITAPNGGESWGIGATQSITWSATDNAAVTSVTLEYSSAGSSGPWNTIATGLANSGSYDWTIPADASTQAFVRATASDAAANAASDTSDAAFAIVDPNAGVGDGPAVLALAPPSPNPGAGAANLSFSLPKPGHARLDVLDVAGRRVAGTSGEYGPGRHAWTWDGRLADGSHARAGLYLVRLTTPFGTRLQRAVRLE
jgi:hypothetical protein